MAPCHRNAPCWRDQSACHLQRGGGGLSKAAAGSSPRVRKDLLDRGPEEPVGTRGWGWGGRRCRKRTVLQRMDQSRLLGQHWSPFVSSGGQEHWVVVDCITVSQGLLQWGTMTAPKVHPKAQSEVCLRRSQSLPWPQGCLVPLAGSCPCSCPAWLWKHLQQPLNSCPFKGCPRWVLCAHQLGGRAPGPRSTGRVGAPAGSHPSPARSCCCCSSCAGGSGVPAPPRSHRPLLHMEQLVLLRLSTAPPGVAASAPAAAQPTASLVAAVTPTTHPKGRTEPFIGAPVFPISCQKPPP